jgi:hypothetical protein
MSKLNLNNARFLQKLIKTTVVIDQVFPLQLRDMKNKLIGCIEEENKNKRKSKLFKT